MMTTQINLGVIEFMAQSLSHSFSFGNVSKGTHQFIDVAAFKHDVEVFHDGLVTVQMFGNVKHGQIRNFNFIGHLLILNHRSQTLRVGNIGLLACFITTAKHDNHHITALHIVHSPTATKMFTHFKNAFAYGFDVAKITVFNSFKPTRQTTMHNTIFKIVKPFTKFGKLSNRDFHVIHLNKHKINLTHHNTPCKMTPYCKSSRGFSSSFFRTGDNSPQSEAVFLCLSFFNRLNFELVNSIMTALFGRPLWSVSPVRDSANSFNAVTRFLAGLCDGFTHFRTGITA